MLLNNKIKVPSGVTAMQTRRSIEAVARRLPPHVPRRVEQSLLAGETKVNFLQSARNAVGSLFRASAIRNNRCDANPSVRISHRAASSSATAMQPLSAPVKDEERATSERQLERKRGIGRGREERYERY